MEDVSRAVSYSLERAAHAEEVASHQSSGYRTFFGHKFSWMNRPRKRSVPTAGTTAFLLKFGGGMEEVPSSRLFASAFTIGASYALGGIVPLLPYFFIHHAYTALYWSIVSLIGLIQRSFQLLTPMSPQGITSIVLLLFGGVKSWFTVSPYHLAQPFRS
jgi:VIT1/CCC1 family predicted Fe2+/Mn2+ transporter